MAIWIPRTSPETQGLMTLVMATIVAVFFIVHVIVNKVNARR